MDRTATYYETTSAIYQCQGNYHVFAQYHPARVGGAKFPPESCCECGVVRLGDVPIVSVICVIDTAARGREE